MKTSNTYRATVVRSQSIASLILIRRDLATSISPPTSRNGATVNPTRAQRAYGHGNRVKFLRDRGGFGLGLRCKKDFDPKATKLLTISSARAHGRKEMALSID